MGSRLAVAFTLLFFIAYWLFIGAEVVSFFNGCNSPVKTSIEETYPRDTSIFDKFGRLIRKYEIFKPGDTTRYIFWNYNKAGKDSIKTSFTIHSDKIIKVVIEFSSDSLNITKVYKKYDHINNLVDSIIKVSARGTKKIVGLYAYNSRQELRYSFTDLDSFYIEKDVYYDSVYQIIKSRTDTVYKNDTSSSSKYNRQLDILEKMWWGEYY
jgi:hypothetical protein